VLLRLLGVSCRLIGAAKFVEDGAGAIDAVLLLVRLAATVTMMVGASLSYVAGEPRLSKGRSSVRACFCGY
jgi:hypothetical protein